MPARIPEETEKKIVMLYESGRSVTDIMEETRTSSATVRRKIMLHLGNIQSIMSYYEELARKAGYISRQDRLNNLAKKAGYKSRYERDRALAERRRKRKPNRLLSRFLRLRMKKLNENYRSLGRKTGLSPQTIGCAGRGISIPSRKNLMEILKFLQVQPELRKKLEEKIY